MTGQEQKWRKMRPKPPKTAIFNNNLLFLLVLSLTICWPHHITNDSLIVTLLFYFYFVFLLFFSFIIQKEKIYLSLYRVDFLLLFYFRVILLSTCSNYGHFRYFFSFVEINNDVNILYIYRMRMKKKHVDNKLSINYFLMVLIYLRAFGWLYQDRIRCGLIAFDTQYYIEIDYFLEDLEPIKIENIKIKHKSNDTLPQLLPHQNHIHGPRHPFRFIHFRPIDLYTSTRWSFRLFFFIDFDNFPKSNSKLTIFPVRCSDWIQKVKNIYWFCLSITIFGCCWLKLFISFEMFPFIIWHSGRVGWMKGLINKKMGRHWRSEQVRDRIEYYKM